MACYQVGRWAPPATQLPPPSPRPANQLTAPRVGKQIENRNRLKRLKSKKNIVLSLFYMLWLENLKAKRSATRECKTACPEFIIIRMSSMGFGHSHGHGHGGSKMAICFPQSPRVGTGLQGQIETLSEWKQSKNCQTISSAVLSLCLFVLVVIVVLWHSFRDSGDRLST